VAQVGQFKSRHGKRAVQDNRRRNGGAQAGGYALSPGRNLQRKIDAMERPLPAAQ
jgi:hypothetical protein